ncbi:SDR family oxidoreductase [Roseateles amylovorans]|jgi:NAD(P)-dependent dehydrogenase (short-subunit alcohol dehydrogenase family)|uniref:SDR family oxidoreductase n=1 Tax=Roseateles amylovorans TaxID=2978473 RepID=A0ABY6AUD3_9BURK|nr:SDR family oxidoreductase [Roseateles amylovorans]UXH76390.1 SDR family oxidoreductase [Roseateles amylovorans]
MDSAYTPLDAAAAEASIRPGLTTRFAVVTGAGSGIGRAAARKLMQAGWQVALLGRREDALRETASIAPDRALVLPTDVTDEAQVAAAFQAVQARFGRLDLLFNNAGMGAPASDIDQLTVEKWRAVVDVNLTGSFLCAREAFALMKQQTPRGGRIINNGSISAHAPRPGSVAYTCTKHAITGLTKTLALDGRKHDIACGQLDIGNAETDLTARFKQGVPQAHGDVMVEPVMDVDHAASALLYMAELPLSANVPFLTVMATKMPYIGRG